MTSAVVDFAELMVRRFHPGEPGYFRAVPDGYGGVYLFWVTEDDDSVGEAAESADTVIPPP